MFRPIIPGLPPSMTMKLWIGVPLFGVIILFCASLFLSSEEYNSPVKVRKSSLTIPSPRPSESTTKIPLTEDPAVSLDAPSGEIESDAALSSPVQEMAIPVFYRFNPLEVSRLQDAQVEAVCSLMREYNDFYASWSQDPSTRTVEDWNKKTREFELELMRSIGSEALDRLTLPPSHQ